jgi:hypothetical protein
MILLMEPINLVMSAPKAFLFISLDLAEVTFSLWIHLEIFKNNLCQRGFSDVDRCN